MSEWTDTEHSEFGASASPRWLACPGSIQLSRGVPKPPESIYAKEGTEAHRWHEVILQRAIATSARLWLDGVMGDLYFDAVMTDLKRFPGIPGLVKDPEMRRHAKNSVGWILGEFFKRGDDAMLQCEQKVSAEPFLKKGEKGTLDAAIVERGKRVTVVDYKYGAGIPVDADSSQLIYYALALSYQFDHDFKEAELVVIQPRAMHESGKTIRKHVMEIGELKGWAKTFKKGMQLALSEKPPLKSGKHCRFCPAAVKCPELTEKNFDRADISFSKTKGVTSVPEPYSVKEWDMPAMLDAAEKLEIWIERLRSHAYAMAERGEEIPGWKLVDKRAQRKWSDPEVVRKAWGQLALKEPKVLSPAELEKIFKAKKGILSAQEIKERVDWIQKNTVKESSGTTLVRHDDKRKAVPSSHNVFKTIDV